jgi:uncharacterized protein (DUF1800 family)
MGMKPLGLVVGSLLVAAAGSMSGAAASRFDVTLSNDKHAVHVLNRLTYGPRPGDLDEIRRIGVEPWIRRQLNPRQIPENTELDARLKLGSLQLATWQILETYQQQQPTMTFAPPPSMGQLLRPDEMRTLTSGPGDERRAILASLTPDVRRQVLAQVSPQSFEGQPDLKREAEKARLVEQEIRNRQAQEQQRRFRPSPHELLTPEQSVDLQQGTEAEKAAVLSSFDREKRTLVFRVLPFQPVPEAFRREALAVTNPQQAVTLELIDAKLYRAIHSTRQLEEVLVDFWLNHFNVFNGKGSVRMFLTSYERDAIRPHVLGRFRDMLQATARHPAMLFYLDNYQSRAQDPASSAFPGARPGINENYARELMELHTLGVNGGYTQADVINVARAFTGWTIFEPARYGEFQFNPAMHDRGEKVVLGHTLPRGGGEDEGRRVIDILVSHPSTARFISRKLAQRFVADDPPQTLVDRMAATFTKSDGNLRAVMETLLLSPEFLSEGAWRAKFKSPLEMVVSSVRALNAEVTDTTALAQRIADLGQPLYGKPEPTGYPNATEGWASSAGLLGRMNFAMALVAGKIAGAKVSTDSVASGGVRRTMTDLLGVEPSAASVAAIEAGADGKPPASELMVAALIASPDFQKR